MRDLLVQVRIVLSSEGSTRRSIAVLADAKVKARIADLGYMAVSSSPGDFANFIASETEKWGKVIRAANIRADKAVCSRMFHTYRSARLRHLAAPHRVF
jgi:hypothetical protein